MTSGHVRAWARAFQRRIYGRFYGYVDRVRSNSAHQRETEGRCMWDDGTSQTIWDRAGQAGAKQAADKVSDCEKVRGEESWYPTSRKNERDTPNFLYAALDRTACAPLFKERRMKFRSPRNSTVNRGYGAPGVLFEGDGKKPSGAKAQRFRNRLWPD